MTTKEKYKIEKLQWEVLERRGNGQADGEIIKEMNKAGHSIDKAFLSKHVKEAKRFRRSVAVIHAYYRLWQAMRAWLADNSGMRRFELNKAKWFIVVEYVTLNAARKMEGLDDYDPGVMKAIEAIELDAKITWRETNA